MKMILMSVLAVTLVGCAGSATHGPVATTTGGRSTEPRVYSLTGEQTQKTAVAAEHRDYGTRSLPRPN